MNINYLKNKKYHILAPLFCLCYALGAQKVAAGDNDTAEPIQSRLTYEVSKEGTTYTIERFDGIVSNVYKDTDRNIALFVGKSQQSQQTTSVDDGGIAQQYIFISHDTSFISHDTSENRKHVTFGNIQVIGFPVEGLPEIALSVDIDKNSLDIAKKHEESGNDNHEATLAAYSKSWLWGSSFIFEYKEANQHFDFYYRKSWFFVYFIEATKHSDYFYEEISDLYSKQYLWEVAPAKQPGSKAKEIVARWEVKPASGKMGISNLSPSTKGSLYHTLVLDNNMKYTQLTDSGIIVRCMAIVLAIVYATFHKAIHKKVTQLVDRYILRKQKISRIL